MSKCFTICKNVKFLKMSLSKFVLQAFDILMIDLHGLTLVYQMYFLTRVPEKTALENTDKYDDILNMCINYK